MFRIFVFVIFAHLWAGSVSAVSLKPSAQFLPQNALDNLPILQSEKDKYWPTHPMPSTLGAQVEQETCISLRHSRCWSPRAELKTSRENGVGLGQITRAFNLNGTIRFDALAELKSSFPKELEDFNWTYNLYDPRLQLRALVLKDKQNYQLIQRSASEKDRLAFSYAAYNGGLGGLNSDRQVCAATPGCDPGRWFGNVENTSLKAKRAVDGYKKSFFEINREYVTNVMEVRRPRYELYLK